MFPPTLFHSSKSPSLLFGLVATLLKSIYKGAPNVTLQKEISHPSLVIYYSPTPPIKLRLGLLMSGRLLIATHLDQSNYLANQLQALGFAVSITSLSIRCKILGQNHFAILLS
jgi:hypothetical protein